MKRIESKEGFTLIELVLATAIFSLFMVATIGSFTAITKLHHHAVVTRRAMETARLILDKVTKISRDYSTAEVSQTGGAAGSPDLVCGDTIDFPNKANSEVSYSLSDGKVIERNTLLTGSGAQPINDLDGIRVDTTTDPDDGSLVPMFCVFVPSDTTIGRTGYLLLSFAVKDEGTSDNPVPAEFSINGGKGIQIHTMVTLGGGK